ncbi:hypothetical protein Pmani_022404 [Petrolisthes manimaculis]|uniref:Alanine--glyoxylate aminotransferase n=1 Tax=Petrolisthes manimaculis TaxID=1843537 RepID=A0AAE1PBS8_9EUCA|nr:hypothetical protein Pmani_022404 [Petrolisthes manimaculis]
MTTYTEKKLFTPGPLCVPVEVKGAMGVDLGSRDHQFISCVAQVRAGLLKVAQVSAPEYTCVPLQGSGTYCVEAVVNTASPRDNTAKVLVLVNGAYGRRIVQMCEKATIPVTVLEGPEHLPMSLLEVEAALQKKDDSDGVGGGWSMVCIVHCETSSGVINPICEVGQLVRRYCPGASYMVDAMSSFGAVEVDMVACGIDFLVSSANKCLEGVPGFAYAICRTSRLLSCKGNCRVLSLDLVEQHVGLEVNGQFRFTPPTHALLAFNVALTRFWHQGGVQGRAHRYKQNNEILVSGMEGLGYRRLVQPPHASYIITAFHFPKHEAFSFTKLYNGLAERGLVIYPGKVTSAECFRIGNIGDLHTHDINTLLQAVKEVMVQMGLPVPLNS